MVPIRLKGPVRFERMYYDLPCIGLLTYQITPRNRRIPFENVLSFEAVLGSVIGGQQLNDELECPAA